MKQPRDFSLHGAVDLGARQAAAQRRQQATTASGPGRSGGGAGLRDRRHRRDVQHRCRRAVAHRAGDHRSVGRVVRAVQAAVARSWRSWPPRPTARGSWPRSTSTPTRSSAPRSRCRASRWWWPSSPGRRCRASSARCPRPRSGGRRPGHAGRRAAAGWPGLDAGRPSRREPAAQQDAAGQAAGHAPGRTGPGDAFADPAFGEAQEAMESGDLDGAAAAFEKVLASAPANPAATMGLAQVDLIRRVNSYDQAKARRDADDNPDDPDAQGRVADIDVAMGRIDAGLRSAARHGQAAPRATNGTGPGCTCSGCSTSSRPGTRA